MMVKYFIFAIVVLSSVLCGNGTPGVSCNHRDAFRCANGECIYRYAWCDSVPDCSDNSDEEFCNGDCLASHFRCKTGRCIPMSGVCDNYADCEDGSDEVCEGSNFNVTEAVSKAATFFLRRMTENGWESLTPRVVVALSFADKASSIREEEKTLIVKQLNIYLKADLIHKLVISLSDLAFVINGLYATCQDPRNFQGKDLVGILRSRTNHAMKQSHFEYPIALLTLCIADNEQPQDIDKLTDMYKNSSNMGFKALVVMAMACIGHKNGTMAQWVLDDFMANDQSIQNEDVYTKALYLQATHAIGYTSRVQLMDLQLSDGSFGDMLATYHAIPALLKSSLLDLRCNSSKYHELHALDRFKSGQSKEVVYALWLSSNSRVYTHTLGLKFEGNATFYDIMLMAADRDPLFSFLYDETPDGKKVYSLAGIPNDAETEKSWVLYLADADMVLAQTPDYQSEIKIGVDRVYPEDKNYFVFLLKR